MTPLLEVVYNFSMPEYRFYQPIEIRYGDLDPQGHLNNAKYLTFMEQARINYVKHLGLWNGGSFLEIGIILAEIGITFRAPVLFGQPVRVGARVTRLGNKSMTMDYRMEDSQNGQELAAGTSVVVAYSYREEKSIPIPEHWRQAIKDFEGLSA
ncbi:MAG TPA: thioesterase family protein [Anaerolineales bacterium]|nr:thioesterase family protein [Anaerolineales bacterium]